MAPSVCCSSVCPRSRQLRRLAFLAALLLLPGIPTFVWAQASALSVEVESSSNVSRTGGPISLALRFDWRGSSVVDGQLLIELRDSENDLLGTYLLDDLYLTEGVTRQEVMLSGVNVFSEQVDLDFWLLDKNDRTVARLGTGLLRLPGHGVRSLAIAVYRSELSRARDANDTLDRLRLESLLPDYNAGRDRIIVTRTIDLDPDDAPADPLRLCTYDLVLLTGDGLEQLREPQRDALLAWVRAGGSICLVADMRALDEPQLEFINALLESDEDDPAVLLNSSGEAVSAAGEDIPGPLTSLCGLGRVVIVGLDESSGDASAGHWPETVAFLWRLRTEHLASIATSGRWDIDATINSARTYSQNQNQYGYGPYEQDLQVGTADMLRMQATDMDPVPINGGAGLLTRLMPGDIRVVPLWMIGLVLVCYVLAIGPLDYLVLGRLGLRRLTWISFPAVTLLFTACSVAMSNSFLSVAAERKHLVIRDLDDQGVVTRENTLAMLFPSRSRTMTTELGRGLFCPLRHQDFSHTGYYFNPYSYPEWERQRAEAALYRGRMPTQTVISQRIGQWTPQLNRSFTIPLPDAENTFAPLADPQLDAFVRNGENGALVQRLRSTTTNLVGIYLLSQEESVNLQGPQFLFRDDYGQQWNRVYIDGEWVTRQADFLQELSMRQQPGFFAVVSQIAPTGGYRFEDMALLDPTDDGQRLLVVAVEEDDQLVLYRKLYVLDD